MCIQYVFGVCVCCVCTCVHECVCVCMYVCAYVHDCMCAWCAHTVRTDVMYRVRVWSTKLWCVCKKQERERCPTSSTKGLSIDWPQCESLQRSLYCPHHIWVGTHTWGWGGTYYCLHDIRLLCTQVEVERKNCIQWSSTWCDKLTPILQALTPVLQALTPVRRHLLQ